mmetsp:Transcript_23047/g.22434  ORF Transcript_23047/g.22434 Transcript_23047/m.22434 type:complete len:144 (+) Transcript_23047:653-1084(+)
MNWDLFKLTPLHFVQNLLGQGVVFSNDSVDNVSEESAVDERTLKSVKKYTEFFCDLAMQEYEFQMSFRPSVVAIACIICARAVSKVIPQWNKEGLEELTDYEYQGEVKQCTEKLLKVYEKQFSKVIPTLKQGESRSNKHNKEN